jgi:hypothetical protein
MHGHYPKPINTYRTGLCLIPPERGLLTDLRKNVTLARPCKGKTIYCRLSSKANNRWEQQKAILKAEPKASDPAHRTGVFTAH